MGTARPLAFTDPRHRLEHHRARGGYRGRQGDDHGGCAATHGGHAWACAAASGRPINWPPTKSGPCVRLLRAWLWRFR